MFRAWVLCCLLLGLGCGLEPAATEADAVNKRWSELSARFTADYLRHHPVVAVSKGLHAEYDGKLPDWSRDGLNATADSLRRYRDEAQAFEAEGLDDARRLERDYLIAFADGELFWLESARAPFTNPFYYMHWALDNLDPGPYVTREYAPLETRLRGYVGHARGIPAAADQIRENLELPLARPHAEMARDSFSGLATYLRDEVPGVFAAVEDEGLQGELAEAGGAAAGALDELSEWFAEQSVEGGGDFRLGAERFEEMVRRTERVEVGLERLREIGREDFDRNRHALLEACAEAAPGKTLEECVEGVRDAKPAEGAINAARRQLGELRAFLDEQGLVGIPGREQAEVEETPPHMRWNFAFIDIPGPFESGLPSTYYISPPDPSWPAAQQHEYLPGETDLLFASVHEVWPGHFLQNLHAARSSSEFGRVFVSYAFSEGWAHYVEEMMWEAGYGGGDPKVRIGMLLNALLRNARYLAAIGLHTGEMSLADAERFFIEEACQDAGTAKQQALRGTFDPAYLNYTMGKLMIRKLREDWTASSGGREAWRAFHDRVLEYGAPPVPLLRRALLGEDAGPAL